MADLHKFTSKEVLNKVLLDSGGSSVAAFSHTTAEALNAALDATNSRLNVSLAGGTISGDVTISGDLTVSGGGTLAFDEILEGTQVIDVTNTEALLVRKNSDGGDVFVVDTTNSRVGIGGAPSYALDVQANLDGNVARFYNDGNDGNRDVLLLQGGADSAPFNTRFITFLDGDGGTVGCLQGASGTSNGGLALNITPDTNNLVVDSTGNVGIGGLSNPGYKLEVGSSVTGDWVSRINNTATSGNPNGLLVKINQDDSTGMILGVLADTSYRMVVKGDGSVGIGTTAPEAQLEIQGSSNAAYAEGTAGLTNGATLFIQNTDNTANAYSQIILGTRVSSVPLTRIVSMNVGANDADLAFVLNTKERMRIDGSTGYVGIGVADPDSELEIFHATDPQLKFSIDTHGDAGLILCDADGMKLYGKGSSDQMRFHCDTTEVMRIATNSLLIGKTTDSTALANAISLQAYNGQSESGQAPVLFHKANAGHAVIVAGESAGVEDCSHFKNSSTAWGGATKGIIKITDASAGASTTNFFYCEDSGGTEARLDTNGLYYGSGTSVSAIDYAEFFESKDGKAIPFGTTVKLDGDKIVPCSDGETPIGVIRPNEGSSVLGGNSLQWHKKYKRTDYDAYETEDYEVIEWEVTEVVKEAYTDENGDKHEAVTESRFEQCEKGKEPEGVEIPSDALVIKKTRRIVNPDYDSSKTYIERKDRDEWNLVGLLGQVPITKGQPVASNWIKMRDVSENVEMYLIK